MLHRRIPEWVRHAPTPGVRGFAVLSAIEALARGMLVSVFPLALYKVQGDAQIVSQIYFIIGLVSLVTGFLVPTLTHFIPRRWIYTFGAVLFITGVACATRNDALSLNAGLLATTVAIVIIFICTNAYVLDFIAQAELGRCETLRMFYSALAWGVGPVAGVWLMQWWFPAPFIVSGAAMVCLLTTFWILRLGNGRLITKVRRPAPNPIIFLGRFFVQPRLIAGWIFATLRSTAWWVYVVYLPIFAIENGLGDTLGGITLSISNSMLFFAPLILRWMQNHSVRHAVRIGFLMNGLGFIAATTVSGWPWLTVAILVAASFFLVMLDICAGLPFLMAVKPSERTEMSAVYASYRDVSGMVGPGLAWLVLLQAPVVGVFAVAGGLQLACWQLAGRLHPRLGKKRTPRAAPLAFPALNPTLVNRPTP